MNKIGKSSSTYFIHKLKSENLLCNCKSDLKRLILPLVESQVENKVMQDKDRRAEQKGIRDKCHTPSCV